MTKLKKLGSFLLALIFAFSMTCTAFAADDTGTITITNANIGETYHVYKLFDATYSTTTTDDGNTVTQTTYVATAAQKAALEEEDDNVFTFTALADGTYQVTLKDGVSDGDVIDFVKSYVLQVGKTTYCTFPGASEVATVVADSSTEVIENLAYGYYFVTSTLGSAVTLSTTNPDAEIVDKNESTPDWDNEPEEPEPDEPSKDVLNEAQTRSINTEEVEVGQILTYSISYTNTANIEGVGQTLTDVEIYDYAPDGTIYVDESIAIQVLDEEGNDVTAELSTATDDEGENGLLTWTVDTLPYLYTVVATFQVEVTEDAYELEDWTIVNEADMKVTLGENTYWLKTNEVENPVDDEPDKPVKDVKADTYDPDDENTQGSIDGNTVSVGQILTYTITYENTEEEASVDLTIEDAPPAGTVYVAGSATSTLSEQTTITVASDGTITWFVDDLAAGATVTVYFQVEVTEAALSITDNTIVNTADYSFDGENFYETNVVKNPTEDEDEPDEPEDEDFGKVIVNDDGTETHVSTGAFGDTVKFDVSIDAVNLVEDEGRDENTYNDQVAYYYIYDQMDPGLTLNDDSFTVSIYNNTYTVTYDADKTAELDNGVKYYTIDDGYGSFLFTYVDEDGYTIIEAKIAWADPDTGEAYYPNCELHLTYTATINEDAVIGSDGNWNRAIYDYSVVGDNNPDEPPYEPDPENPTYPSGSDLNHEEEEITTVTYTYALGVDKVDENGNALAGAVFSFVDAGENDIYAVPTDVDGVYNYTSDSTVAGATKEFTSNSDGQIIIKGVDIGTYTLTEVKAPSGYTLLTDSVTLKATMTSSTATTYKSSSTVTRTFDAITEDEFADYTGTVYTKDEDGTFVETEKPEEYTEGLYKLVDTSTATSEEGTTVVTESIEIETTSTKVVNKAGSSLPSTGGMGTTLFYVVGGVLAAGAVILLITKKRMAE
ncbi:MAG: DUF11 domain-containing protein [Clostridiales bacterium]|nr:DUF11 domain-containing protein [Clostridiales bacterium]